MPGTYLDLGLGGFVSLSAPSQSTPLGFESCTRGPEASGPANPPPRRCAASRVLPGHDARRRRMTRWCPSFRPTTACCHPAPPPSHNQPHRGIMHGAIDGPERSPTVWPRAIGRQPALIGPGSPRYFWRASYWRLCRQTSRMPPMRVPASSFNHQHGSSLFSIPCPGVPTSPHPAARPCSIREPAAQKMQRLFRPFQLVQQVDSEAGRRAVKLSWHRPSYLRSRSDGLSEPEMPSPIN